MLTLKTVIFVCLTLLVLSAEAGLSRPRRFLKTGFVFKKKSTSIVPAAVPFGVATAPVIVHQPVPVLINPYDNHYDSPNDYSDDDDHLPNGYESLNNPYAAYANGLPPSANGHGLGFNGYGDRMPLTSYANGYESAYQNGYPYLNGH